MNSFHFGTTKLLLEIWIFSEESLSLIIITFFSLSCRRDVLVEFLILTRKVFFLLSTSYPPLFTLHNHQQFSYPPKSIFPKNVPAKMKVILGVTLNRVQTRGSEGKQNEMALKSNINQRNFIVKYFYKQNNFVKMSNCYKSETDLLHDAKYHASAAWNNAYE